jgi:hypothetical protein
MIPFTCYDLETKPHSREVLESLKPEFKASAACKSAEAIAKSIAEKESDFFERAALSPFYGSIVVIGTIHDGQPMMLEGDEKELLHSFWALFSAHGHADMRWCFWSGCGAPGGFDLKFIIQRSMILGVKIPAGVRNGRFFSERIIDLAATFLLHDPTAYLSLTNAANILGLFREDQSLVRKAKSDEVQGANFHLFYDGLATIEPRETQRAKALSYLGNDLKLTSAIARRIL